MYKENFTTFKEESHAQPLTCSTTASNKRKPESLHEAKRDPDAKSSGADELHCGVRELPLDENLRLATLTKRRDEGADILPNNRYKECTSSN